MQDFFKLAPQKGAERVSELISSLTIFYTHEFSLPLRLLDELASAISQTDYALAHSRYHKLTAALLNCGARRISGDLWLDYLFSLIISCPNAFALAASRHQNGAAERKLAENDLNALGELSALSCELLSKYIVSACKNHQPQPAQKPDVISVMSSSIWAGSTIDENARNAISRTQTKPAEQPMPEIEFASWEYGEFSLRDTWVADEALEEIYIKLLKTYQWGALADDLWNLFAEYGSDVFLQSRFFSYAGGKVVKAFEKQAFSTVILHNELARAALISRAIAFLRGENNDLVYVCGAGGCGKKSLVTSLPDELPPLRMVTVNASSLPTLADAYALCKILAAQPLRFLLMFDDFSGDDEAALALINLSKSMELPKNVLLAIIALDERANLALFPITVLPLSIDEFVEAVGALLPGGGANFSHGVIRNACIDFQADRHLPLTISAAVQLANLLVLTDTDF